ncbi:MAG: efflux RND transporter periplasmic adaptor subunit [Minisyncoccota bacterium]
MIKTKIQIIRRWVIAHKIGTVIIVVAVVFVGYNTYKHFSGAKETRYVLTEVQLGTIASSVSGTGYVSSENQIDIRSKVSGDIVRVYAKAGDKVYAGQIIAEVDSRDALLALQNQQIVYQKLVKPADAIDVQAAEENLNKSYSDAWGAVSNTYLDMPTIISGLKDIIYATNGYLNKQNLRLLGTTAVDYSYTAGQNVDKAENLYEKLIQIYKGLDRSSSQKEIDALLGETYNMAKQTADALKDTRNAVNYISQQYPTYSPNTLNTTSTNINTWSQDINSSLSNILSAGNSILTNKKTLDDLREGADSLDVQASALALRAKENAYSDYFIRAPYDGLIAKVDVSVGSSASGATIATIVSKRKFAEIPLNEIDAAGVKIGDKVKITFDAIPGFLVEGAVEEADLVGTIDQGVVTYNIKISFEADERVRAGMSASVDIITNQKENVIVVPASAVKTKGPNRYVDVFNPPLEGTKQELLSGLPSPLPPTQKIVQIGLANDTEAEITDGLTVGDQVVIRTIAVSTPAQTSAPTIFGGGGAQSGNVKLRAQ